MTKNEEKKIEQDPDKLKEQEMIERAINIVAGTSAGKTFLKYLVDKTGVFTASVVQNSTGAIDINGMAYNEGLKAVYLNLIRPKIKSKTALNTIER